MSLFSRLQQVFARKTRLGPKELALLGATIADSTARGLASKLKEQGVEASEAQWLSAFAEVQLAFHALAVLHARRAIDPERLSDFGSLMLGALGASEERGLPPYVRLVFTSESILETGLDTYIRGKPDERTRSDYDARRKLLQLPSSGYLLPGLLAVRLCRLLEMNPKSFEFLHLWNLVASAVVTAKKEVFNDRLAVSP